MRVESNIINPIHRDQTSWFSRLVFKLVPREAMVLWTARVTGEETPLPNNPKTRELANLEKILAPKIAERRRLSSQP